MAKGTFEYPPPCVSFCKTSCSVCTKEWHRYFLPVYRDSVSYFLDSSIVMESMPLKATRDSLPNLLWNSTDWISKIVDKSKSSVARYNVESLMLQLIAKEFIVLRRQTVGVSNSLYWYISKSTNKNGSEIPLHPREWSSIWDGITLYDDNRTRKFKNRKKQS